ncbi:HAD family hydrolase [Ammonicoccus fulvus]|uniref:HAD family hydrolase n=1 Tax=Ammonicoccus fulvus TaxID=3138240 RepID=A0ABZ3FQF6_9ACTN
MTEPALPRLIATDLDGTLLRSDTTVGDRTRQALDLVRSAGVLVVPVTARQPVGIRQVAGNAGFTDWAVCSNGAYSWHLTEERAGFVTLLEPEPLAQLVTALGERVPAARFAVVRDFGRDFVAEEGYAALSVFHDHAMQPRVMRRGTPAELVSEPCLKFVARSDRHTPPELYAEIEALGLDGIAPTLSGAPFVEVAAAGVSKATGLARLCADLGIEPQEVVAFGDARNDVAMLEWAGHGVAMANAVPQAQAVADEVLSTTNDDEAVAEWLMARFAFAG